MKKYDYRIFVPEKITMSAFFLLIGISLVVAVGFLIAFLWAVKTNQYEDDYTPSVRMLFNDNTPDTKDIEQNNLARKDAKAQRKIQQ